MRTSRVVSFASILCLACGAMPMLDDAQEAGADARPEAQQADAHVDAGNVEAGAQADADAVADADAAAPADASPVDAGPRYDESLFMATHNSYSGGDRGSIGAQLDEGVRFVEMDLHDDSYDQIGDYQLGHDKPGNQVATGNGNPATLLFRDWLAVVAAWSDAHPAHAPIAVALDLKSDLTDNASFAAGNLGALDATLASSLGTHLLAARDVPAPWPAVSAMRGRILVVLSGDEGTRRAYRLDSGNTPAVAMNAAGQVVEVHASAHGDLWTWTGAFDASGGVRWMRHARFGKGTAPAVALSDTGLVVEVHESGANLAYRAGVLGADLEIAWQAEATLAKGAKPSVRTINGGPVVRAVWNGSSGTMAIGGALAMAGPAVHWDTAGAQATSDPRFDTTRDERNGRWVSVRTGVDGLAPADTLLYSTASIAIDRIRYDQVAFVEHQKGGDALLAQEARFYAAAASEKAWLGSMRANGRVVRGWQFDDASQAATPPSNFPATDTPAAAWYVTYTLQLGVMK